MQPILSITPEKMALHTRELAEATMRKEAHQALVKGAKALAFMAIEVMMDDKLRSSIREVFEREKQS